MLIHQESVIAAAPRAVYEVLTDSQKFAAATGMPAQLGDRAGEAFSLFGGRIEGRQIELVPGQRIGQAWRFGAMHRRIDAGVYSVVRFTLGGQQDGAVHHRPRRRAARVARPHLHRLSQLLPAAAGALLRRPSQAVASEVARSVPDRHRERHRRHPQAPSQELLFS